MEFMPIKSEEKLELFLSFDLILLVPVVGNFYGEHVLVVVVVIVVVVIIVVVVVVVVIVVVDGVHG